MGAVKAAITLLAFLLSAGVVIEAGRNMNDAVALAIAALIATGASVVIVLGTRR